MQDESKKSVFAAIAANATGTIIKFVAAVMTGSSGMLSQAIQSAVDTADSALLLLGMKLSRKPPDRNHPMGHGRELYFWTMIMAAVICAAGGGMNLLEGISRILHPQRAEHLAWNYAVLAISAVLDGFSLAVGFRQYRRKYRGSSFFPAFRESKDPTTFAVILEDGSDLLGIAVAFLGMSLGNWLDLPVLDGVASVAIGAILTSVAFLLGRECHGLLIGEAAGDEMLERIRAAARIDDRIERIGNPLTMYFGPHDVILALSVQFRKELDAHSLAQTIDEMESAIRRSVPDVTRIFIEAESFLQAAADGQGRR